MKRIFGFLFVVVICLLLTTAVVGCSESGSQDLEFTLTDNDTAYSVSGIGACKDVDVVIPSTHQGKPVTSLEYGAFQNVTSIKSVSIPDSVTLIGARAFDDCTSLESITIGDGVKTIGDFAFWECTSLTSITMGDGVTEIGRNAFEDCTALESVTIPNSVEIIGSGAFADCAVLKSVSLGNSVVEIGERAFGYCSQLESITIPSSVESIGANAFYDCYSLNYYEYDNAYYLGNADNQHLVLVKAKSKDIATCEIHQNTKIIYIHAFYDCTLLDNITIPDSVKYIESCAFASCESIESITIPSSVTYIGSSAFAYCEQLNSVTFEVATGWYTAENNANITTNMDVTDPIANATKLVSQSYDSYWKRNA